MRRAAGCTGKLLSSRRMMLKRGRCSLIRLYSSSSASVSESVTVTSTCWISLHQRLDLGRQARLTGSSCRRDRAGWRPCPHTAAPRGRPGRRNTCGTRRDGAAAWPRTAARRIRCRDSGRGAAPVTFPGLAAPGDHQRQLQRLFVVQARIHLRAIGARKVRIRQAARAAGAFGDILARSSPGARRPAASHWLRARRRPAPVPSWMFSRRRVLYPPTVVSVLPCMGSHTHSTVWPVSRTAWMRRGSDFSMSLAPKRWIEREPSRLVVGIQRGDQPLQPAAVHRRADLHADRDWRCRGSIPRARHRAAPCACRSTACASTGCTRPCARGMNRVCACS